MDPIDFIFNGQGTGDVATRLLENNGDVGALRPWKEEGSDGVVRSYVTRNQGGKKVAMVTNANALLRKDDWLVLDQAIVKAAKPRLKAVADLRSRGLQMVIPNGLGKTVLDTESQSDMNEATVSMDGLRESQNDRPVFSLSQLPLPIIHKDFNFSMRQVMASRNGGSPLDTTGAELAARRVAELAEQLLCGTATGLTFGGGTIYGYTNFTGRMTKTLTSPLATSYTPATTVTEILAMRAQAQAAYHYGPYMLYTSLSWDSYLDNDYKATYNETSLRERIKGIEGIIDIKTLDYLPANTMVLVQMTADVARMIVGMDITTVQWESKGGMQLNFKVMAIIVPQLRADFNGNTGIVHGSYA